MMGRYYSVESIANQLRITSTQLSLTVAPLRAKTAAKLVSMKSNFIMSDLG